MNPANDALADALDIFHAECRQFLAILDAGASALDRGDPDPELLEIVQRAVHSAKGGAGAFGYAALHRFAHALEDVLKAVRTGEIDPTGDVCAIMVTGLDLLAAHIASVIEDAPPPVDAAGLADLRALTGGQATEPAPDAFGFAPLCVDLLDFDDLDDGSCPWLVRFTPAAADLIHGREPLLLLRELARMGGAIAEPDLAALPSLDHLDPRGAYLSWHISLPAQVDRAAIEACFDFLSRDAHVEIARAPARTATTPAITPSDALRA